MYTRTQRLGLLGDLPVPSPPPPFRLGGGGQTLLRHDPGGLKGCLEAEAIPGGTGSGGGGVEARTCTCTREGVLSVEGFYLSRCEWNLSPQIRAAENRSLPVEFMRQGFGETGGGRDPRLVYFGLEVARVFM